MKRKALALTLVVALVFSVSVGTPIAKEGKANPLPNAGIEITLKNPKNITYDENAIPVILTATQLQYHHLGFSGISLSYSLDNKERKPILNVTVTEGILPKNPPVYSKTVSGYLVLFNLSEGWHKIAVYCQTYDQSQRYSDDETIAFFVDTVPILSFLSFENKTFDVSEVPLDFTVNQPTSQIQYSLDGQDNVTIVGNMTLSGLYVGEHNLTIYAWDTEGNVVSSETVYFTIAEPVPEPFPTTLEVASVVIVAVIVSGLLVNFKKHKW